MDQYEYENGIEAGDVGISLPDVEELKTDNATSRKRFSKKVKLIGIATVVALVLIIGLSAGLSGKKSNSNSSSNAAAPADDVSMDSEEVESTIGAVVRYEEALHFIENLQLSTPAQLADATTPQHMALSWIANKDKMKMDIPNGVTAPNSHEFVQRYILAVMYYALDGSNWVFDCSFLSSKSECEWNNGINADGTHQYKFGASCGPKGTVTELFMRKFSFLYVTLHSTNYFVRCRLTILCFVRYSWKQDDGKHP